MHPPGCAQLLAWRSVVLQARHASVPEGKVMPQPVTVFLRQGLVLKAAIAACLKKASPKRVHHLRSTTRRIDATLQLLVLSTGIPRIDKQAKSLQRSLRKLRRAAGAVRDADVQYDL